MLLLQLPAGHRVVHPFYLHIFLTFGVPLSLISIIGRLQNFARKCRNSPTMYYGCFQCAPWKKWGKNIIFLALLEMQQNSEIRRNVENLTSTWSIAMSDNILSKFGVVRNWAVGIQNFWTQWLKWLHANDL